MSYNLPSSPGASPDDAFASFLRDFCIFQDHKKPIEHVDYLAEFAYGVFPAFDDLPHIIQNFFYLNDLWPFLPQQGRMDAWITTHLLTVPYREIDEDAPLPEADEPYFSGDAAKIFIIEDLKQGLQVAVAPGKGKSWDIYARRHEKDWVLLPVQALQLLITLALISIIERGTVYRDPVTGEITEFIETEELKLERTLEPLRGSAVRIFRGWWFKQPKLRDSKKLEGEVLEFWFHAESGLLWQGTATKWKKAARRINRS